VLATPPGLSRSSAVPELAPGQCLAPRGTAGSSRGPGHGIAIWRLDAQLSTADQDELAGAGRPVPGDLAVDLTTRAP
jgi:hypothetical protein